MNIEKLIQIVAYILKKNKGRINYTKLIKILYLADRKSIEKTGWSITGDSYVCMNYGPVLTNLYKLIKDNHINMISQAKWDSCFLVDSRDLVAKTLMIPFGILSDNEIDILDETESRYHNFSYSQMIDVVHDKNICPEWEKPIDKPTELTKEKIMRTLGFSEETINYLLEEETIYKNEEKIFEKLECI